MTFYNSYFVFTHLNKIVLQKKKIDTQLKLHIPYYLVLIHQFVTLGYCYSNYLFSFQQNSLLFLNIKFLISFYFQMNLFIFLPVICLFLHDVSPSLGKLSTRAIKCVFLGYFSLRKGNQCYSSKIRKVLHVCQCHHFEKTIFFPSFIHDDDFVQQVFPIPLVEPLVSLVHDTLNQSNAQSSMSTKPSLPPIISYQHMTQMANLILHGKSSSSNPSPHHSIPWFLIMKILGWLIAL